MQLFQFDFTPSSHSVSYSVVLAQMPTQVEQWLRVVEYKSTLNSAANMPTWQTKCEEDLEDCMYNTVQKTKQEMGSKLGTNTVLKF